MERKLFARYFQMRHHQVVVQSRLIIRILIPIACCRT